MLRTLQCVVLAALAFSVRAQTPPCAGIPSGLISWWRAEGDMLDGWDSNNGSVIQDVPYGIVVNVAYAPGKVGQAFNLYTNGVLINDNVSLRLTNALTIEGWVNPSNITSSALRTIFAKFASPNVLQSNNSYYLGLNSGKLLFKVSSNGVSVATVITPQALTLGQWWHVAATYDGFLLRLYTNGVLAAQTNYSGGIFAGTADAGIGAVPYQRSAWYLPWTGQLDEISVYNRALFDSEIAGIYNSDLTGKCLAPPTITVQPQSQAVPQNEDAVFSPTVVGSKPMKYQWQFNGANLAGASASTLLLEKVQSNAVGNYSCVVTNALGRATSSAAALTLLPPLTCITAPTGMLAWWPANNFSNDVVGSNDAVLVSGPFSAISGYITGKVAQCFNFSNGYARVPNSPQLNFGSNADFSIEAWLKYLPGNSPLGAKDPPQLFIVQKTEPMIFGPIRPVTVVGYSMLLQDGRLACQLSMPPFTTDNIPTFLSPNPDLRDGMFHHVALTVNRGASDGGRLYVDGQIVLTFDPRAVRGSLSNSAALAIGDDSVRGGGFLQTNPTERIDELTVYNRALSPVEVLAIRQAGSAGKCVPSPNILLQPTNQIVNAGSSATMRVVASGFPALIYQWIKNGTNVLGGTAGNLVISNAALTDAGQYAVSIANSGGSVTSVAATLTINQPPLASNIAAGTKQNQPISIPIEKMMFYAFDPDGDPLALSAVSATSTNGGTVVRGPTDVTYTPVTGFIGTDSYSWSVSDSRGGSASALVLIQVRPTDQVSGNMLPLTAVPGGFQVGFFGIPGRTYTLQRAESISGPWTTLDSVLVGPDGLGVYYDTNSPPPTAFYRTVYP
jgi:hypothetical protein